MQKYDISTINSFFFLVTYRPGSGTLFSSTITLTPSSEKPHDHSKNICQIKNTGVILILLQNKNLIFSSGW